MRSGRVRVDGSAAVKPAMPVPEEARIEVDARPGDQDVGRGAAKLRAALDGFAQLPGPTGRPPGGPAIRGRRAVDVGASTGGFTQVLLERGAAHVVALDVGHGQLHPSIASDLRVTERSGVNVRSADVADLGGPFDLLVADLSFVSLTVVMPALGALVAPAADLVLLVKPQFEVGRERLGRDGVVRSEAQRAEAVDAAHAAAERAGLTVHAVRPSQVAGASGNVEYFLWASS